jgi:methionyl-tRNA synthetase
VKTFYITTTLPYVNAKPHVGFAMELIRADAIARYKKLMGYEVFFNTGTDEHGQKLFSAAEKEGRDVKEYVDGYASTFRGLKELLGISDEVHFIRTTEARHEKAAQEFWKVCDQNGYIYKATYQAKYCVGCELEKTDSELVDGRCPIHPNREIDLINEENYFFKWSVFGEKLLAFYDGHPDFVVPDFRYNEIKKFVKSGLQDFSISRQKSKMSWGVPVPGDSEHIMYVWFDALVNYISTLGWPDTEGDFKKFWEEGEAVQICGKDNLRQQTAIWQAMLMAAGIKNTSQIIVEGFINGEGGVKMSKSLGNVISPYDVVEEYGTEPLRYYLLGEISAFEDSPMTMSLFKDAYNAKLANGIGNLTSRILKMSETHLEAPAVIPEENRAWSEEYQSAFKEFNLKKALDFIFIKIKELDEEIQSTQPFKLVKTDPEKGKEVIKNLVICLNGVAQHLEPFLPETSRKIQEAIAANKMPSEPLFLRKD